MFTKIQQKKYNLDWDPSNFTILGFGKRIIFTPEFLVDMKAYHGFSHEKIFSHVDKAIKEGNLQGEIGIRVCSLPTIKKNQMIFSFTVHEVAYGGKEHVVYFSCQIKREEQL